MRLSTLVRVGGTAAILAGVLRAASSFASGGSQVERQALYCEVEMSVRDAQMPEANQAFDELEGRQLSSQDPASTRVRHRAG